MAGQERADEEELLRLVGYGDAKNYDASMGEWANREDTPLER